jgi:hypothetical protein
LVKESDRLHNPWEKAIGLPWIAIGINL